MTSYCPIVRFQFVGGTSSGLKFIKLGKWYIIEQLEKKETGHLGK
jgi:hypothetical protein